MTRREKVMALCVGGALGGLSLVTVVRWVLVEPFMALRRDISAEQEKQRRLTADLGAVARIEQDWQDRTAQTLSDDPKEAGLLFRENIHGLLGRHGLVDDPSTKDTRIAPGAPQRKQNGLVEVPLTVNTTGTLKQIVGFLCDFYRQGYIARLDKVTLSADQTVVSTAVESGRPPRPGRPTPRRRASAPMGPDGPELQLSLSASTLVLPKLKGIDPHPLRQIPSELALGRLKGGDVGDLVAYNEIFEKNPFRPYQPPAPTPPTPQPQTPKTEPVAVVEPPPVQTPVRPDADKKFVIGTATLNGVPLAYIMDETDPNEPVKRYSLDQDIDDGKLLLILPSGLVVRAKEPNGQTKDYFYPLKQPEPASFLGRQEITEQSLPEVVRAMREEFVE